MLLDDFVPGVAADAALAAVLVVLDSVSTAVALVVVLVEVSVKRPSKCFFLVLGTFHIVVHPDRLATKNGQSSVANLINIL